MAVLFQGSEMQNVYTTEGFSGVIAVVICDRCQHN
jgi:hypothetical protein